MSKLDGTIIKNCYLNGESSIQIANKLGVTKEAILYHLRKQNVVARKPCAIDSKSVCEYYVSGKSTIEIAKLLGTTHTRVIHILNRNGVTLRNKKEALKKYRRINVCVICGVEFHASKNHKRKTCSEECYLKHMSNVNVKPNGHSQAYYQRIRRELKQDFCEKCGASPPTRLDTHHIDRDHKNNSKENLMVLCVHCHAYLHYIEDDRNLRGWKKITIDDKGEIVV